MSDAPLADVPADTTDSDAPTTTPEPTQNTVTPEGADTPQDPTLAPDAGTQTDASAPFVATPGSDTSSVAEDPQPAAEVFTQSADPIATPVDSTPAAPAADSSASSDASAPAGDDWAAGYPQGGTQESTTEDDGEPATQELPTPPEPTEAGSDPTASSTDSGTIFSSPVDSSIEPETAPEPATDSATPTSASTDSTTSSTAPEASAASSPDAPVLSGSATTDSTATGEAPPQATATVPIAGPSTDGLPAQNESVAPTGAPDTGAIGSGDAVTDPGSPVVDPTSSDVPDTGIATQVEDDGSATGADQVSIPDAAYGGVADGQPLPTEVDTTQTETTATPTDTLPQAQDPASVRASTNGAPYNAAPADAGVNPASVPTDSSEPQPEPTAVGQSLNQVSPIEAQTANVDDIVGDVPETVGTPYDVYEIQRQTTSFIELVAELGLAINFIELAAFNGVANQRYELYAGDKVRVPHQAIPGRLDGVSYDDDEQDEAPLADEPTSIKDRRDEFQNATSQFDTPDEDNDDK